MKRRDGLSRLFPKRWLNTEFVNGLNEAAQIMSEHFTQCFIDLRRARLAAEPVAKLGLDHREGGFDV